MRSKNPPLDGDDFGKVRRARLDAADMLSAEEAARRIGVSAAEIDNLVDARSVLAIRAPGEAWRFPDWQFREPLATVMPLVLVAFDDDGWGWGWGALEWLETTLGALGGLTPRAAAEQGQGIFVVMLAASSM